MPCFQRPARGAPPAAVALLARHGVARGAAGERARARERRGRLRERAGAAAARICLPPVGGGALGHFRERG
eukprot:1852498-Pyramimonas_sp.AAC.1